MNLFILVFDNAGSPKTTQRPSDAATVHRMRASARCCRSPQSHASEVSNLQPCALLALPCAFFASVCRCCNVRSARVLSHVTVMSCECRGFTAFVRPQRCQSAVTFGTRLSGHRCGTTGFHLLSTGQSAFLSRPSYSGMFIQACACLLVVCSEHHRVIGRPNIIYVKQLFAAANASCRTVWSVRTVLTKKVQNFKNNSLIDTSLWLCLAPFLNKSTEGFFFFLGWGGRKLQYFALY